MLRQILRAVVTLAALVLTVGEAPARAQPDGPLLLRDPSLSPTQIAFSYAGDIWIVNRDGGVPRRLTSGGHEGKPVFSPDGSRIAFVGGYDGTRAVYVIPTEGGEPRRLTYHPDDLGLGFIPDVIGWSPDGKSILFDSRRTASRYFANGEYPLAVQLFTIPLEGGFATPLPLPRAVQGSFSADATRLAYVPTFNRQQDWKGYRGGGTTPIWIVKLADSSIEAKIPRNNSNDFDPMWIGDTIYFLSDRDGPVTLFAYNLGSEQVRKVIANNGLDIKSASASSDAIVYEQFGSLHLFDLKSGRDRQLDIHITGDFPEVRPRFEKLESSQVRFADISPDGKCVVLGARGEILTVSVDGNRFRNLTQTVDAVERDPAWAPDGKSIAYFSDESGEYALHLRDPSEHGSVQKIHLGDPPGSYYAPTWSPDSQKIAYTDQRLNYWYIDLKKKTPVRIDTDVYTDPTQMRELTWSPDSRWIAYTRLLPNRLHAVFVYSLERGRAFQLTDGRSDALYVTFDKLGRYLYFTASTDVAQGAGWMDMTNLHHPVTRSLYAMVLNKGQPSPLIRRGTRDGASASGASMAPIEIDPDGIRERTFALPVPARNYMGVIAAAPDAIWLLEGPRVIPLDAVSIGTTVQEFNLSTQQMHPIATDVDSLGRYMKYVTSVRLSANGEKLLYSRQGHWLTVSVEKPSANSAHPADAEPVDLEHLVVYVDPRAEWAHMFHQVWRNERDFFYDPALHGLNIGQVEKKYEPYLKNISTRDDLNYLFNEMLGNLTVGHLVASGGDRPKVPTHPKTGLLGADYSVEKGRYRFARVYRGDTWDPAMRAPLAEPDVNVQQDDYLLAVNGREVDSTRDIYSFFQNTADTRVTLTVGPKPDGTNSRDVTVTPVDDETLLRNRAWAEDNRRRVDELTESRVAYVYLPDTYERGLATFNRDYFAQVGKEAAIIDVRYNSGGVTADYIVDYLRRPLLNYWHMRYGKDMTDPQEAIFGPKALIINEMTGSGGDDLSWMFRHAGIGPLVGKRTWGGLVGTYTIPDDLLDGGTVSTPDMAFYSPNGTWDIENHGVQPDIEVDDDPKALREGHDPQLERAVSTIMDLLQRQSRPTVAQRPPYPNYQKAVN